MLTGLIEWKVVLKEAITTDTAAIEIRAAIMANMLLKHNIVPNLIYTYYIGYCPERFILVQEKGGSDLPHYKKEHDNKDLNDDISLF